MQLQSHPLHRKIPPSEALNATAVPSIAEEDPSEAPTAVPWPSAEEDPSEAPNATAISCSEEDPSEVLNATAIPCRAAEEDPRGPKGRFQRVLDAECAVTRFLAGLPPRVRKALKCPCGDSC